MAFENYTVRQYMKARFGKDFSELSEEEYEIVHTEYTDVTGMYLSEEFEKVSYINFLTGRINSINLALKLHRDFYKEFGIPFVEQLIFFKKYGYRVTWNDDEEDFFAALSRIELAEKKFVSQLENRLKLLEEYRARNQKANQSQKDERGSFIKMLNSLGKNGYRISQDRTTVEELSYMVKQELEK